jgi:exopolysaccharide production protein ExoZ
VLFALIWIQRSNRLLLIVASAWMALILAAGVVRPEWASERFPTWSTVVFSARNLPFICGIFAYFLYHRVTDTSRYLLYPAVPAGAFGITLFGSTEAILASTTISVFALLLLVAKRASQRDLRPDALLVQYGNYSYGLYLVHVGVITILLAITPLAQRPVALSITVLIVMSLALGLGFGAVENAMYRRLKRWYTARSKLGWRSADTPASLSKA